LKKKKFKIKKHKIRKEKESKEIKGSNSGQSYNAYTKLVPSFRLFLGIFIVSAAVISFEIIITRISSLVFTYNYAFVIISLAILGLGSGGIYSFYRWRAKNIHKPEEIYSTLSFNSGLFSIFIGLFAILITTLSFFTNPFLYFSLSFIPFFFAGIVLSLVFQSFAGDSFRLYASDLVGAASGAVIAILILDKIGGANSVLFISLLGIVSSFLFIKRCSKRVVNLKNLRFPSIVTIIFIMIFVFNLLFGFLGSIPVRKSDIKDLYLILNEPNLKAEIVESRWSAFGRTDLVGYGDNDSVKFLFIDGAAGTPMFKFDGDIENAYDNLDFLKMIFSGTFPFFFLGEDEKDNMLIVGPGGGREIIIGLSNGVKNIVGVEINEDFVDIVKEYKEYNGGIYADFSNVEIIVNEGRSYIRSIKDKFDIIMIIQPFTKSSRSFEGYTLTENYLLTVESIKDYLNHLSDEGRIITVLHNNNEILRFITSAMVALEDNGIDNEEAMKYFYTVGKEINPVLVLKKNPFTVDEAEKRYEGMLSLELVSRGSYIPYIEQETAYFRDEKGDVIEGNLFNDSLISLAKGEIELTDLIKETGFNIKPTTDDRPFFFKDEKGIPKNILPILIVAIVINVILVIVSIIISRKNKKVSKLLALSLLLGFGFIIIEISFFQKLILYMGSPIISLAVILGSLLMGMGIGSFSARKIYSKQNQKKLVIFSLIVFIVTTGLFFALSAILNNLLGFSIYIKALISSLILIPIGFILGIPFPTGIRLAEEIGCKNFITWMYGINGTMAVLGSVTAISLSTVFGFSVSIIIGVLCYLAVAIIFMFGRKSSY